MIDRRHFLRGAAAVGAGLVLPSWPRLARAVPRVPEPAVGPAAPPEALRQIQHVVFFIQELSLIHI